MCACIAYVKTADLHVRIEMHARRGCLCACGVCCATTNSQVTHTRVRVFIPINMWLIALLILRTRLIDWLVCTRIGSMRESFEHMYVFWWGQRTAKQKYPLQTLDTTHALVLWLNIYCWKQCWNVFSACRRARIRFLCVHAWLRRAGARVHLCLTGVFEQRSHEHIHTCITALARALYSYHKMYHFYLESVSVWTDLEDLIIIKSWARWDAPFEQHIFLFLNFSRFIILLINMLYKQL